MQMLDARRRAMLEEMGVKVWWPQAPAAPIAESRPAPAEAEAVEVDAVVAEAPPPRPSAPQRTPVAAPVAARSDTGAAATIGIEAPQRLYGKDDTPAQGGWLLVVDMPPEADGRYGPPLAGDAGRLLDNMLRALRLHEGDAPVHLMRTHRGASGAQGPFADAFLPHAEALAPRIVLAMGPLAAQSLLQRSEPLGRLRGQVVPLAALADAPAVATYHPTYLLRNPADKARAWADLCLAAEAFAPQGG